MCAKTLRAGHWVPPIQRFGELSASLAQGAQQQQPPRAWGKFCEIFGGAILEVGVTFGKKHVRKQTHSFNISPLSLSFEAPVNCLINYLLNVLE